MAPTTTTTTRVVASKPKIGSRPAPSGPVPVEPEAPAKGGRKKLLLVVLVLLVLAAGGAWWFLLGPGAASDEAADGDAAQVEPAPAGRPEGEPGEVLATDAISINLADGHYLRLGLGLELNATAADGHGEVSAAKALDAAIALFSGRTVEEVTSPEGRAALKDQLVAQLWETYHGAVLDVYFTDFVTQ